jgi:dihydroorotate dehydrogenase electron transfer subunit
VKRVVPQSCTVVQNKRLGTVGSNYRLTIAGFSPARPIHPGQFVHIRVADTIDPYFRRAFSIGGYDPAAGELEIIYKVVGKGTTVLSRKKRGDAIDLIGPLGNRFANYSKKQTVLLVAGGIGLPPLLFLARHLLERGHPRENILFFYGGRTKDDLIERQRLRKLGVESILCTDDGSHGFHGFVTEAVAARIEMGSITRPIICGCGPEPMLAALQDYAMKHGIPGELSLEAPMPCGVGVCLGCIKPSLADPKKYVRVCYEGPVFPIGEVRL